MSRPVVRRYQYFNHTITSDVELPELCEQRLDDKESTGITVQFCLSTDKNVLLQARDWLHHWPAPDNSVTLSYTREEQVHYLYFPQMACFTIGGGGRLVTCYAQKELSLATIRHLFLDQVLPRIFSHFTQATVLHASFISLGGKGICFVADSGWGKSTMAAGFAAAGSQILTDDCVSITRQKDVVYGIPAYFGVRLLPDSMEHLGKTFTNTTGVVAEYTSKKRIALDCSVPGDPRATPIHAFFLLIAPENEDETSEIKIEPVGGGMALKELLKNSFCLDVHDGQWQKNHFHRVAGLLSISLPLYSVTYPRKYELLPRVVHEITKTLGNL